MRLSEFDYELPAASIAQQPLAERDASRMLWLHRSTGACEDRMFRELPELLLPGDLLVANDSRVFPARLRGRLAGGAAVEVLLLQQTSPAQPELWEAIARPGRKLPPGARIEFAPGFAAEVLGAGARGARRLRLLAPGGPAAADLAAAIERHGHVPLPPYIRRGDQPGDRERYQTVYAQAPGSAAAPTAGLHFTPQMLERLAARGIEWTTVSLHVGLGTFQPVESEQIEAHPIHRERFAVGAAAAAALTRARRERRRIVAVGTTAARVLETIAPAPGADFAPAAGETALFLYPGRSFQVVEALLTNFHAPRSTLLMMIAAFAGLAPVRRAYQHALAQGYRFLSYGDCMFIG
ncbi:MAG TPA: tRNA preQ1(34) S-adenosylmethionine ribosyltransferase-isomerase QueA [Terriglobales bacterium]|nr:tRNA preQ1(34) S-adenosylmethionine ribosyltransferase-isomerase QueA [Terriglobales bacterium]